MSSSLAELVAGAACQQWQRTYRASVLLHRYLLHSLCIHPFIRAVYYELIILISISSTVGSIMHMSEPKVRSLSEWTPSPCWLLAIPRYLLWRHKSDLICDPCRVVSESNSSRHFPVSTSATVSLAGWLYVCQSGRNHALSSLVALTSHSLVINNYANVITITWLDTNKRRC